MPDDNANIETAMCLWEAVQDGLQNNNPLVQRLIDEAGTVAARFTVASWIPECEAEWEKVKDDFDQPFDWEFCPAFLQRKLEGRYAQPSDPPR